MTPDRWQKRQDAKRFKQVTGGIPLTTPAKKQEQFTANELRDSGQIALIDLKESEADRLDNIRFRLSFYDIGELRSLIDNVPFDFWPLDDHDVIAAAKIEYTKRLASAFQKHHEISAIEFREEHWQVLFAIEYPEASS